MGAIKERRLTLPLKSHASLHVGDCVPFYFCPRSVMLYVLHMDNHSNLTYHGGQGPIIHLEADLNETVAWAEANGKRWAFTLQNAGTNYFDDRCDLAQLEEIDWDAVAATQWSGTKKEGKQAEFLIEERFPWDLVSRIGVRSRQIYTQVSKIVCNAVHKPHAEIIPEWYY